MSTSPPTAAVSVAEHAYREFVDSLEKSPATRTPYVQALHYYMDYLGISRDGYDKLLDKDPKIIQMNIGDFIKSLGKKGRGLSYATISTYADALKKFYDQNDIITINWKKIRGFMGEHERVVEDRPYNHEEIRTLLSYTSLRNRGIILTMASGGLRLGAIPGLRIRDLEPNDTYGIYKIIVYPFSIKSRYTTWCSPAITQFLELLHSDITTL